jgi:hypothetical protein
MRWPSEASLGIRLMQALRLSSTEPAATAPPLPDDGELYPSSVAQAAVKSIDADIMVHAPSRGIIMGLSLMDWDG